MWIAIVIAIGIMEVIIGVLAVIEAVICAKRGDTRIAVVWGFFAVVQLVLSALLLLSLPL